MSDSGRFYDKRDFLFTSESVSEGHPDKVSDRISDSVLDRYLREDPYARVAVETFVTKDKILVGGEVRAPQISRAELEGIIRTAVKDIGYAHDGFHWERTPVDIVIHEQSADIAQGVDAADRKKEGAGDQGIMFGYACDETPHLMPACIHYSHEILRLIFDDIRSGALRGLGPDAKSQVTLKYHGNKPVGVHSVVVSIQHEEGASAQHVRDTVREYVRRALPGEWELPEDEFYVNPTGKFVIGGPVGDCGLTGRKIVVDTYGGAAPHGGGAFSGKDPSKVDRSAAYMARYLAKNVVAMGMARACTIQLSYAIGVAKPLSFYINTHGTATEGVDEYKLADKILSNVDLTPWGIREHLKLHRAIYTPTSAYGHFGREYDEDAGLFPWEQTDLAKWLG